MAVTCSYSSHVFPLQNSVLVMKPFCKFSVFKPINFPLKQTHSLRIKSSSIKNKVFEDEFEGVICHMDENGEMICEGYDEGPRYHEEMPRKAGNLSDAEIIDLLLQQNWIQILNEGGGFKFRHGVDFEEDLNVGDFNTFC